MAEMQGEQGPNNSLGGLDGLPAELKAAILALSSDFDSLKALVHASRSFYHAYHGARRAILSTVVVRELHVDVISDALAVVECPRASVRKTSDGEFVEEFPSALEVCAFIARYKEHRQAETPSPLPLSVSIDLICFHKKIICHFTDDFGSSMLAVHPLSKGTISRYSPLSATEIRRIHRAFYRFELYYRIFAGSQWAAAEWLGFTAPTVSFLSLYPPWEVEELHCVHDFLYRRFSVAYMEVAHHDVRMSNSATHPEPLNAEQLGLFVDQIEHNLSLGLRYVYEALTLPGLENRIELHPATFSYRFFPGVVSGYYRDFRGLGHAEGDGDTDILGDSLSSRPNEAWTWWKRYILRYPYTYALKYPLMELRKWGYCMWDSSRLRVWGVRREEYDEEYFRQKVVQYSGSSRQEWMKTLWTEAVRAPDWLKGGSG